MIEVNAMGEACPIPVVKTLHALQELNGAGTVQTLVDNEIAVQNLTRLAESKGCAIRTEKRGEKEFCVTITTEGAVAESGDEEISCTVPAAQKKTVVVISADHMGEGDDELGRILLKGFLFALTQQEKLPSTLLFYNGGARVTCEGSPSLEDLKNRRRDPDLRHLPEPLRPDRPASGRRRYQHVRYHRKADAGRSGPSSVMRRRRPVLVIAFSSTEQALAAEALFTNSGLPGRMIPIPSQVSAGCGLAWKAEVDERPQLLAALAQAGCGYETDAVVQMYG